MSYCDKCVTDKSYCEDCRSNPIVQKILLALPKRSYFKEYIPCCPRGYTDCVYDPAYIKYYHPEWYKETYGDKGPAEALYVPGGCFDRYQKDPEMIHYCYDDEDK